MAVSMTLDEALRPTEMTCVKCGGALKVYPCPIPEGTSVCAKCSPSWVDNFAKWMMNQERLKRGLEEVSP